MPGKVPRQEHRGSWAGHSTESGGQQLSRVFCCFSIFRFNPFQCKVNKLVLGADSLVMCFIFQTHV